MMKRTYTAGQILAALQTCAPELIGYSERSEAAFRAGWSAAMNRVYESLGIAAAIDSDLNEREFPVDNTMPGPRR